MKRINEVRESLKREIADAEGVIENHRNLKASYSEMVIVMQKSIVKRKRQFLKELEKMRGNYD